MGAIGEDGVRVINQEVLRGTGVSPEDLARVEERERRVLHGEARPLPRGAAPPVSVAGRTAVVVDDGVATGSTARAACRIARARGAARIVLAVPVAPGTSPAAWAATPTELVCLETPWDFAAVGQFCVDFAQTEDEEVTACLRPGRTPPPAHRGRRLHRPGGDGEVRRRPAGAGGSPCPTAPPESSPSPTAAAAAGTAPQPVRGRGTAPGPGSAPLLFDLLTDAEEADRGNVFDIALLAGRLLDATRWLREEPRRRGLAIGYFGASTGAAAALWAAADPDARPAAVVSAAAGPTSPDPGWAR